jgi:hypothetical protein
MAILALDEVVVVKEGLAKIRKWQTSVGTGKG